MLPAGWSDGDAVPHVMHTRAGKRVVERIDLPRMNEDDEDPAVADFGDGSFLLSWQGTTYLVRDGVPRRTDIPPLRYDPDAAALAADGTLIIATEWEVWRAWPDGRAQPWSPVSPSRTRLSGGRTICSSSSQSDKETAFALWRPSDDRVARLTFEELE